MCKVLLHIFPPSTQTSWPGLTKTLWFIFDVIIINTRENIWELEEEKQFPSARVRSMKHWLCSFYFKCATWELNVLKRHNTLSWKVYFVERKHRSTDVFMIIYLRELPSVWSSSCSTNVTQPSSAPSAWTWNTAGKHHTSNSKQKKTLEWEK